MGRPYCTCRSRCRPVRPGESAPGSTSTSPISAPYGQRNRHQKFWMNTESTTSNAITAIPVMLILRKKLSILTSAMMLNGASMNSFNASAVMLTTMKRKKGISTYFRLRSGMSSHRGTATLRLNSLRPSFQRYGAHRTKPRAERLFQQQARQQKYNRKHHRRRMDRRRMMGHQKILQVHQACDGNPAIQSGWPFHIASLTLALEVMRPPQKFNREPRIQR